MKQVIDNIFFKKLVINNKTVFDNNRDCFVVVNSFFLVCETVVDNYAFQSRFVASSFFPCTCTDMRGER